MSVAALGEEKFEEERQKEICGSLAERFQNVRDCRDKNFNKEFLKHFLMKKKLKNNSQSSENACENLTVP